MPAVDEIVLTPEQAVGAAIRQAREATTMSVQEVAWATDRTRGTIDNMEAGRIASWHVARDVLDLVIWALTLSEDQRLAYGDA